MKWDEIEEYAIHLIKEAGKRIRASFQTELNIATKSNANDLVTNIDQETEQYFISNIKKEYPNHKIMGEEGFGEKVDSLDGIVWIIDPIDGTINFVHQQRNFAISIGIYDNGTGVIGLIYDVVHDELYHATKGKGAFLNGHSIPKLKDVSIAEAIIGINATWVLKNKYMDTSGLARLVTDVRGTRSYGSAAMEFAYVATGRIDSYISMRLAPWDIAAGIILIEEVGGFVSTVDGKPLNLLKVNSILAANATIHNTIVNEYIN